MYLIHTLNLYSSLPMNTCLAIYLCGFPGVCMAPWCLCSNDVYAVTQKSCSGQEYWTSGDLEPSSALSTLVIVSLHGATPMRGVGVCDNGESLLFNTSSLSPSLSLSLFVQVGGYLKGTGCGVFNYSCSEPSFFFPSFSYFFS